MRVLTHCLLLLSAVVFLFSCEKENLATSTETNSSAQLQLQLPSGKPVNVTEGGYLHFKDPAELIAEVEFINQHSTSEEVEKWIGDFQSMRATFLSLEKDLGTSEDASVEELLGASTSPFYQSKNGIVRPAQANFGYSALISKEGLIQVGEELHLLTTTVQISGKPILEENIKNFYKSDLEGSTEGLTIVKQNNDVQLAYDTEKLNAKPMNCPHPGVAHQETRSDDRIVGEVFTGSYAYSTSASHYHHLNWYINAYSYETYGWRNRRQRRVDANLRIDPDGLVIQGGLFRNNIAQSNFQVLETIENSREEDEVNSMFYDLKSELFITSSRFDMRTDYAGGEAFVGRQGFYSPGVQLGVLIYCD